MDSYSILVSVEDVKQMRRRIQQKKTVVAYLGPDGTFSEQAAKKYFSSSEVGYLPLSSIEEVFKAVKNGKALYGVVPVENSLEGSVNETLDLLLDSKLMAYGEVELRIEHCLIVKPHTRLEDVKLVLSKNQALAQCRQFLVRNLPKAEIKEVNSTAKAVEMLRNMKNVAAIGTENAAEHCGMTVLVKGIEDNPNNFTRFFILSKEDSPPTRRDKTSIIFSAKNIPGSLYNILGAFAIREINLTKVESRPVRGRTWEYIFYLDFEGHRNDTRSRDALKEIEEKCIFIKILGSYPKAAS